MKNILLTTIAIAGLTVSAYGQGFIYFDGSYNSDTSTSATSDGQVWINGVWDSATDINCTLYGGSSVSIATNMTYPIVTLLLSVASSTATSTWGSQQPALYDITDYGAGGPFDASGQEYAIPNVSAGAVAYFVVAAWLGSYTSYSAAYASGVATLGITGWFQETATSAMGEANNVENMPALNLYTVPEPSTLALVGLAGLALLVFRRRS
jgi:hypothetical protein